MSCPSQTSGFYDPNYVRRIISVTQSAEAFASDPELRSGVGSIPAWTDYSVGFFPKFFPTVKRISALNITESANILDKYGTVDTRKVRQVLREKAFENWSQKKHKGKGVLLYQQYTPANKWIRNHKGLSCSEWREAIKMNANVSAVCSVPGRSSGSNLCRRCDREVETLDHVLGACPHGELLRNTRHHTVRSIIATALRNKGYSVYEEVHGISSEGSNRRIDIIAFKPPSLEGYIIDPTVRFESHEHQPEEVHEEKRNMYEPSISFYKDKYHLESSLITQEGLLLVDIMPHGTTINSDGYVATLKKLQVRQSRVRRHRENQDVLLLHDNAQPYVSHKTTGQIRKFG
ncbi:hypothetical protein ANN_06754 [Periplaneta americana]|uniref:Reverse transcriptase n=1 Tax=Periplaneta americana TaxID=6978 RepID=A0ABQ8TEI4_PERAM|nr:hypothetical protein ANN_06754 [Periplaneta americana]